MAGSERNEMVGSAGRGTAGAFLHRSAQVHDPDMGSLTNGCSNGRRSLLNVAEIVGGGDLLPRKLRNAVSDGLDQ